MPVIRKMFIPRSYEEGAELLKDYTNEKSIIVVLSAFDSVEEARRLKDFLLGYTYASGGIAFQWDKTLLLSILKGKQLEDIIVPV